MPTTRERILRISSELIREHGAAGLRLDDVLSACGVSAEQFFHLFESRAALVREAQAAIGAVAGGPVVGQLDDWDGIRAWFAAVVAWYEAHGLPYDGPPVGATAAALPGPDGSAATRTIDTFAGWQAELARGLSTMRFRGLLRPDASPYGLAEFVIATLQGGLAVASAHGDLDPLANALKHALAHLRGFAA